MNSLPHRSSRRLIGTALVIASSSVGSDKHAHALNYIAGLIPHCLMGVHFDSKSPTRVPKKFLLCEQPRGMDRPNTSGVLSAGSNKNQSTLPQG